MIYCWQIWDKSCCPSLKQTKCEIPLHRLEADEMLGSLEAPKRKKTRRIPSHSHGQLLLSRHHKDSTTIGSSGSALRARGSSKSGWISTLAICLGLWPRLLGRSGSALAASSRDAKGRFLRSWTRPGTEAGGHPSHSSLPTSSPAPASEIGPSCSPAGSRPPSHRAAA